MAAASYAHSSLRSLRNRTFHGVGRALFLTFAALNAAHGGIPAFLRTALNQFSPEISPKWAYTMTTDRDGKSMTERFDPSKPPTEQWSLLLTENRPPTAGEQEKYFKYKASQAPGATRATFQVGDIEPGTVTLLKEDADQAEFNCAFREQASNSDKMLALLSLRLTVNKKQLYVEKFALELKEPYSPVLGVKMRELLVAMAFSPPGDNPSLPVQSSSHFLGRIFFISMEENLHFAYSDFRRVP
jgi:hypothetical protein